jgi:hypothetical protein|tara:strand:+ start:432 stop:728 length:297 start_codon:yes stop_codon:yes gene_type:complete
VALEPIGNGGIDKLLEKLRVRYPSHDFSLPPKPDTKCKQEYECKKLFNVTYSDQEGNIYCGRQYKKTSEDNPYMWEYRECHALLQKATPKDNRRELPF